MAPSTASSESARVFWLCIGEGGVATRAPKSGGEPDPEDRARDRAALVPGSSSKSIHEPQDLRRLAASTAAGPDPRGSETQLPSGKSV
ncbi:hypothetical protein AMELA_G00026110 [Ameiurus melas]|uniref:Uncharacterized protein n=1 Tax=Ameiurus melas TaxID=219545 RepID=A0A7J6BCM9_AMEME|nr:hypothetical protein AMELA_G00026110 [Ameiurus melas]